MFFLFYTVAAFALTWQLPKAILTCKQTRKLTVSTWRIKRISENCFGLPFCNKTSRSSRTVPQLSCQKNSAVPCSNEDSQLPLLQNLITQSWTDGNSCFRNEKLKRGLPKPWVNTDTAAQNNWTLRWYMKLRDLSEENTSLSPWPHNHTVVHFWCYFCTETSFTTHYLIKPNNVQNTPHIPRTLLSYT